MEKFDDAHLESHSVTFSRDGVRAASVSVRCKVSPDGGESLEAFYKQSLRPHLIAMHEMLSGDDLALDPASDDPTYTGLGRTIAVNLRFTPRPQVTKAAKA